jgi:uncharacterized membrane protein YdjX (TVP38/TMEM64 family)
MERARKNAKLLRLATPVLVVAALIGLALSGTFDEIDSAQIKTWIIASGLWGPGVFIILLTLLQPLYVSVYLFLLAAVAIWGPWTALPICWLGIQGACLWPYLFTRHLVSEDQDIAERVPERARPYLERISEQGLGAVFVSRLVFYTATPIQWCYGMTPVKTKDFVLGTGLGTIPMTALTLFLGEAGISWWSSL